jgi:hypothetical protein
MVLQANGTGPHTVYTEEEGSKLIAAKTHTNSMRVVYDGTGQQQTAEDEEQIKDFYNEKFDDVKVRLNREWNQNNSAHDPISKNLQAKQIRLKASRTEQNKAMQTGGGLGSNFTASAHSILHVLSKAL